jgi:hypothetical protein
MHPVRTILATAVALTLIAGVAGAVVVREEHVNGGVTQLTWTTGFSTDRRLEGLALGAADPAYANPSGDHTVGGLTTAIPDSGGLALSTIDPAGQADYSWEGWIFTGNMDTRRGLVVRANPASDYQNCYVFVLYAGGAQLQLRKLYPQPTPPLSLKQWLTGALPGGVPLVNTWHFMKIECVANQFRCWWDNTEITAGAYGTPIVDATDPYLTGNVGVYSFNFSVGGITTYFDDLVLSTENVVPTSNTSWGRLKALYR